MEILADETASLGFWINPSESAEVIRATLPEFQAAFHHLFQGLNGFEVFSYLFCQTVDEICKEDGMREYMATQEWKLRVWSKIFLSTIGWVEGLSKGYVVEMLSARW